MAEKVVSPGVFTSEIDQSFLPAAVGEIGAAIIGPTVKGPAGIPTVVTSLGEFEAKFGTTFKSGSGYYQYFTSHAAREYLKNSGQVTVVRILAGSYSHASSSVASTSTAVGSTFASGCLQIATTDATNKEVTIGGVDFTFVSSSGAGTVYNNTSTAIYIPVTPTAGSSSYADSFVAHFNAATSKSLHGLKVTAAKTTKTVAAQHGSTDGGHIVQLSGSEAGTISNLTAASSSANFQFLPKNNGNALQGGTNTTNTGVSFKLHTLADGADQNSYGVDGSNGSNNLLPSGSKDNIRWEVTNKNNSKGEFTLVIRKGDDTIKRKQTLETWNNLSLDPNSSNYILKIMGDQKNTIRTDENSKPYLQLSGSYPNKSKYVRVEIVKTTPDYLDSNGNLVSNALSQSLPAIGSGSFQGGSDGTIQHPRNFYNNITDTNSQGLNLATAGGAAGYDQYIEALNLLSNDDEYDINMIAMPGVLHDVHGGIVQKALTVCEDRSDCFVIADPVQYGRSVTNATTEASEEDSNYGAMYWPWIQIPDVSLGNNVWVPPSTVMPGIYAFNDKVAHPWFAPAGLNRGGIDVAIQAERKLTQSDRDTLYESSVNPIATFPGQGVVVFGQKTLQKKASALDRVNVRRLLIRVKKFIASSSRFLVFEQNTNSTRRRFLNIVNPFLEQIQANSGLNAFRVVMDDSNNTPDLVDRNILYGQIFVQPTRTAEFIILDFTVQPTGATFPE